MKHQELREEVARTARTLESGLVVGTSGPVSARASDANVPVMTRRAGLAGHGRPGPPSGAASP